MAERTATAVAGYDHLVSVNGFGRPHEPARECQRLGSAAVDRFKTAMIRIAGERSMIRCAISQHQTANPISGDVGSAKAPGKAAVIPLEQCAIANLFFTCSTPAQPTASGRNR